MKTMERPPIAPNSSGARNAPFINLEEAIEKARVLHQKAKRAAIHLSTAASYFGYSRKASSLTLIVSALKKYGLAVDEGSAEGRRIKLSDLGFQIVADTRENSHARELKIQHAALLPKSHRDLWEQFGSELPDENTLRVFLVLERGYTEDAARNAVKVYRATILYAGLDQRGILGDVGADDAEMDSVAPGLSEDTRPPMDRQSSSEEWNTLAPARGSSVRTLSIPLKGSRTFDLRFPENLSKEDFEFVVENMKLWQSQIVETHD